MHLNYMLPMTKAAAKFIFVQIKMNPNSLPQNMCLLNTIPLLGGYLGFFPPPTKAK